MSHEQADMFAVMFAPLTAAEQAIADELEERKARASRRAAEQRAAQTAAPPPQPILAVPTPAPLHVEPTPLRVYTESAPEPPPLPPPDPPRATARLAPDTPDALRPAGETSARDDLAQGALFAVDDAPPSWAEHWKGMPQFEQRNLMPWQSVKVHFRNAADREAFALLIGQKLTDRTQFVWHPRAEIVRMVHTRYIGEAAPPKYPLYIISKGRWESRLTARALEEMNVPYSIVVEPQEFDAYAAVIKPEKILTLPFSNLGQGSIPARNWVWEHSISIGAERHWILDDNIGEFFRLHQNLKIKCTDGALFTAMEQFVDRYTNIAMAGPNYHFFAKRKQLIPPYVANTRVYSCILLDNAQTHRWRGRYNEDTDLSLRILKGGACTVLFNAFLAGKAATMTMKGGNTDVLYQGDGRRRMAESLHEQHPDCVNITQKWNRWQHHVDYTRFRSNKFVLRDGVEVSDEPDEFGLRLSIAQQ